MALFQRLRSLILVKVSLRGDVCKAVSAHLWKHYKKSPFSDRFIQSGSAFVRPLSRMQEVGWELPTVQATIFFKGWRPILLGGLSWNDGSAGSSAGQSVPDSNVVALTAIRGLIDVEGLIVSALDEYNEARSKSGKSRYKVKRIQGQRRAPQSYGSNGLSHESVAPSSSSNSPEYEARFIKWMREEIGAQTTDNPLGALAIPDSIKPAVDEFLRWKESENWFRSKLIPWRRGWLLYGSPGTGKTSLVRALAQLADMPVWSYDLSSLSNEEMVKEWREMQENAPCVALFEDIDAAFKGRENRLGEQGGGLTFDCLLNCLGGIETCDGVFTIITTNHVDQVDPALGIPANGVSSRPGRLDRAIEMPHLPDDCLKTIAQRILGDWPEAIAPLIKTYTGHTGAQFTEACVQEALERYWGSKNG